MNKDLENVYNALRRFRTTGVVCASCARKATPQGSVPYAVPSALYLGYDLQRRLAMIPSHESSLVSFEQDAATGNRVMRITGVRVFEVMYDPEHVRVV